MKQILLLSFGILLLTSCQKSETIDNAISDRPGGVSISGVRIGRQVWSSRNLDVNRYRNGDPIPQVTDPTQWSNLTTGAWGWYNNDSATYAASYGRLYNWYAVNDPRGLAPAGWHIPTSAEWSTLTNFLGGATIAGGALKSVTGWDVPNTGATNSSGFGALPAGARASNGYYGYRGQYGYWWCSATGGSDSTYIYLNYDNSGIFSSLNVKKIGFSVRCIKN